jgi:fatty acid synthase subunit alpha, fungi type
MPLSPFGGNDLTLIFRL